MAEVLASEPLVAADYTAVADPVSLRAVDDIASEVRLLLAARIGSVRLIDNVAAYPPVPATGSQLSAASR
jgi:pantothenate synthetase